MENSFDITLCNPTLPELQAYITFGLDQIQKKAKGRKVQTPDLPKFPHEFDGLFYTNGGSPREGNAQTTRLGIVWFTDGEANKHVRILMDRHKVSSFFVAPLWWSLHPDHYHKQVYPDWEDHKCPKCWANMDIRHAHWDFDEFVCLKCHHTEQYYQETGFLPVRLINATGPSSVLPLYRVAGSSLPN
jgi:hypothetical protein